jgi:hypothetical protein
MRGDFSGPFNPSQAPQGFAQDFRFVLELRFVRDVLVIAPTAHSEMGARRNGAARRRLDYPLHPGANEFLFLFDGHRGNALGGQHEGHEDGGTLVMRETISAVNQFFDGNVHGGWRNSNNSRRAYVR